MMVIAIMGILLSTAPILMTQLQNNFLLIKTRIQLQEEARPIMEIMMRNLRQASAATISIGQQSGQPYYSQITFTEVTGSTVTFYQSGTDVIMKYNKTQNILTKDVVYLNFGFPRSDDMNLVSVAMTLQDNTYRGQIKALHMSSQEIQVMNQ